MPTAQSICIKPNINSFKTKVLSLAFWSTFLRTRPIETRSAYGGGMRVIAEASDR